MGGNVTLAIMTIIFFAMRWGSGNSYLCVKITYVAVPYLFDEP